MTGMRKLMHIHTSQWTHTRHIFRFSRSGKREVDVNHNSDYSVILLSRSPVTTRHQCVIQIPYDLTVLKEIKVNVKSCNAQIDESLL